MKRKSVFKSVFTLVLFLALLLSLAVSVSAATITINGGTQAGMGGAGRFRAYQIFEGSLGSTGADKNELVGITWGSGVDSDKLVAALKGSGLPVTVDGGASTFGTKFTAAYTEWESEHEDSVSEAELVAQFLAQHLTDREYADDFARIVAGCTNETGTASEVTGDGTGWVIDLPKDGYYLVKDTYTTPTAGDKRPDGAASSYILQVSGSAKVTIKSSIPTVEKKVEGSDGHLTEIGEDVNFTLTGTVAQNIGEYKTYSYTFTDTLSRGLTIGELDNTNISVRTDGTTFALGTDYTAAVTDGADGAHILTVTFGDLIEAAGKYGVTFNAESRIVVTYTAKLNASAAVASDPAAGNPNTVTLEYSNNPYGEGTGKSVTDEVKTYTLGLDVTKQNDKKEPLSGVKFKLKKGDNYATLEAVNKSTGDEIEYYAVTGWDNAGTELVTGTDGKFHIHGLSAGTYMLVETEAPKDYETMKDVVFDITGGSISSDGSLGDLDWKLNETNEHRTDAAFSGDLMKGKATLTLTNYKAPILPNTGGIGAKIVYVVSGLAVLIGVCVVLAALRRRRDDPRK